MEQRELPFVLMRGGTSKCIMVYERDLPPAGAQRDRALLDLFGSPDPRQIDGLGGATSTTSKVCILAPSTRPDADIDYTFGQVNILLPMVDYGGNCGNCSSAVGPFAVDEGLVTAREGMTPVRIFNTNTRKLIVAEVPTHNGRASVTGDFQIAGVPGSGAAQRLWFYDPAGSMTGKLLPTGHPVDDIEAQGRPLKVSIVDAANPVVFVRAQDLGMTGEELPSAIDGQPVLVELLAEIRGKAAVLLRFVDDWRRATEVTPGVPKIAVVAPPQPYVDIYGRPVQAEDMDLCARAMTMGKAHAAYQLTGAIATGAAAQVPGTLVYECRAHDRRGQGAVRIGHPSGIMQVEVEMAHHEADGVDPQSYWVVRAAAYRTARRLAQGTAYLRPEIASQ